jgi:hypothetical protein
MLEQKRQSAGIAAAAVLGFPPRFEERGHLPFIKPGQRDALFGKPPVQMSYQADLPSAVVLAISLPSEQVREALQMRSQWTRIQRWQVLKLRTKKLNHGSHFLSFGVNV